MRGRFEINEKILVGKYLEKFFNLQSEMLCISGVFIYLFILKKVTVWNKLPHSSTFGI